MSKDLTRILE